MEIYFKSAYKGAFFRSNKIFEGTAIFQIIYRFKNFVNWSKINYKCKSNILNIFIVLMIMNINIINTIMKCVYFLIIYFLFLYI